VQLYPDDNHKPEMALALTDGFEALCSFRHPQVGLAVVQARGCLSLMGLLASAHPLHPPDASN